MRGGANDEDISDGKEATLKKERIKVVVITGPTAVGKSALAEKLAVVSLSWRLFIWLTHPITSLSFPVCSD
jgi:hypothetical protein